MRVEEEDSNPKRKIARERRVTPGPALPTNLRQFDLKNKQSFIWKKKQAMPKKRRGYVSFSHFLKDFMMPVSKEPQASTFLCHQTD
jgi:hypothetical protein